MIKDTFKRYHKYLNLSKIYMKIKISKSKILIIFILAVLSVFAFHKVSAFSREDVKAKEVYREAVRNIKEKFYFNRNIDFSKWESKKIKSYNDAYKNINELTSKLNDPYTRFLTKDEYKDELEIMRSSFVGIGVKLSNNTPLIIDVIKNSPAHKTDIRPKDLILKINDKSTLGLTTREISNLLRGGENTLVTLEIKRGKNTLDKTLKREELKFKAVSSEVINKDLAVLKIDSFIPENTSKLVQQELINLMSKDIILDLRNNSGGLFKNAVEIADMFLEDGQIVRTVSKTSIKNERAKPSSISDSNIVILVNEHTASASEILASALSENKRARIIGRKTYGKGLVQEVVRLPDNSALHITISAYLTPNGKNIDKIGILPDEVIINEELQLKRAIQILKELRENKVLAYN